MLLYSQNNYVIMNISTEYCTSSNHSSIGQTNEPTRQTNIIKLVTCGRSAWVECSSPSVCSFVHSITQKRMVWGMTLEYPRNEMVWG